MDGSSPLARGLPVRAHVPGGPSRIIPARAGFTLRCAVPVSDKKDHPRSRGVYWTRRQLSKMDDGSSPLARGLQELILQAIAEPGIIPARAGFTAEDFTGAHVLEDHPRSRGVYT